MIFLTGERQSGKTTLVLDLVRRLKARGVNLAGIASPGLWRQDGQRAGFDLLELDTGAHYRLSRRVKGLKPVPFMFDARALEKGRQALSASRCREADLVVVDEVGPLELSGRGWAGCLESLLLPARPIHLWVVRASLTEKVREHFNVRPVIVSVRENEKAVEKIFQHLNMSPGKNSG